jgi:hypothetical protein
MNAVVKEKTVELFAFIIAAILQLLRTAYEYAASAPPHRRCSNCWPLDT